MAPDTDRDREILGAREPYFAVITNERFLQQNLTAAAKDDLYATGDRDIDLIVSVLRGLNAGQFSPSSALDFGCGVGRLTLAMTKYAPRVIGVDVSDAMLEIARQEARERKESRIEWQRDLPATSVDWVNSCIVLQHIPPARGLGLFEKLVQSIAPGGFLSVQVTFFRDNRQADDLISDLADFRYDGETVEVLSTAPAEPGTMRMYDYDLNRLVRTLFMNGFGSVTMHHSDHGGFHGAWLFSVRGAET